jgi:hypothetical protein
MENADGELMRYGIKWKESAENIRDANLIVD